MSVKISIVSTYNLTNLKNHPSNRPDIRRRSIRSGPSYGFPLPCPCNNLSTSKYRTKPKNIEYDLRGNLANLFLVDHSHDVLTLNAPACTGSRNIHMGVMVYDYDCMSSSFGLKSRLTSWRGEVYSDTDGAAFIFRMSHFLQRLHFILGLEL